MIDDIQDVGPDLHNTIGDIPVVPTLAVYIGNDVDTKAIRSYIDSRLYEYVAAGIVISESLKPESLTGASLPGFDHVFGMGNNRRFSNGADRWLPYGMNNTKIRVLVCVLDATCDVAGLKHVYDLIMRNFNVNGVQAEVGLLWCRSQPIAPSELAYAPQMYVDPARLQHPFGVIEHAVVSWVTTGLAGRVQQHVRELQTVGASKKSKQVLAVWLSAAAVYVDIDYIRKVLHERLYNQFMRKWQSQAPSTQAKDELQAIAVKQAATYNTQISEKLIEIYTTLGWVIKSQDGFVYRQTRLVDDDMSGFPRIDTPFAKGMFGNAVSWWLGRWSTQVPSLLVGIIDKVRMVFNRAAELDIPDHKTIARAIKTQYQEVHVRMRDGLSAANEEVYHGLRGFFFSHLLNYDDLGNRVYGLKRMLFVMDKYTNSVEKSAQIELYKQITGKTDVISPIPAVTDDYLDIVSNEHADRLQRLHLKWKRERASLLSFGGLIIRAVVLYPLLLSLMYAYAPAYFVEGPWSALVLAIGLVVVAVLWHTWSYVAYFANIERDRDRYFADVITPVLLSISAHYMNMYRQQLTVKLRRLHNVYSDIDVEINNYVVKEDTPVVNQNMSRHFIIRDIDVVFGSEKVVVDDNFPGEYWDCLRNEEAWIYTADMQKYKSWRSEVKCRLNQQNQQHGKYKAEVTLLENLANDLYMQRRQANTALAVLRAHIEDGVNNVFQPHGISLDVQTEKIAEMRGGQKWCWLAEHAIIDAVPRAMHNFTAQKFAYVVINDMNTLAGASGENSQCYVRYAPHNVLLSRLGNEMLRIELEFDVTRE